MKQVVDCLIIGSGPGASVAGYHLIEAGYDVLMIEEGCDSRSQRTIPYSQQEIIGKYRNSGISPAIGRPRINYAEGSCLGGGSEVNSGLYHRAPQKTLSRWRKEYGVKDLADDVLNTHFNWLETAVGVNKLPVEASRASQLLKEGSDILGWESHEIPRFHSYQSNNGIVSGKKNSMLQTLLREYSNKGGKLLCQTSAKRFNRSGKKWTVYCSTPDGSIEIETENLFLGAGSIFTPYLLRRNGIKKNIGNTLRLHPMLKVIAKFPEVVNKPNMGVGVHQVREFSPNMSFGCSISSLPFLAIGLIEYPDELASLRDNWSCLAEYYAQICGDSYGTIRSLPLMKSPFVRYHLSENDRKAMSLALSRLSTVLFEAGAVSVFPNLKEMSAIHSKTDLKTIPSVLSAGKMELNAVHLVGSCPMGENRSKCATDSYGRVFEQDGLFIVDGSVLCSAPGVNPQGTIMAVTRRNIMHFINTG